MKVLSKEMAQIPNDIGLIQGRFSRLLLSSPQINCLPQTATFIAPRGALRPPLSQPKALLTLYWKRLAFRFRDLLSLLIIKISGPKDPHSKVWGRKSIKLQRSKIVPTAKALHSQMYTAFAENDTSTLRKICVDGIYESFRARIGARPRGEKVVWELVKYNSSPRIASNRAARLPIEGAAIRQAVVRIASKQKLTRWVKNKDTGKLEVAKGSGKEKDVVEYLVIQRQYEGWREGEWKVWGTTNESTLADVEEWQKKLLE
jgi:protein MBA1